MLRLWGRLLRLVLHLFSGVLTILLLFPRLDRPARASRMLRWSQRLLAIAGVEVRLPGGTPAIPPGGALLVANHVSWLDIYVLLSVLPVRFISKAEVRAWPVIGWLAEQVGTVFLVREKKADTLRVNQVMSQHLQAGELLALFPEGTTTHGRELLPFFPSLFQPAVAAAADVWPMRLRYLDHSGKHSEVAAYHGDTSLWQSLRTVLRHHGVKVEVTFLPLIRHDAARDRRELARLAEAALRATFSPDAGAPGTAPENTVHLPA